MNRKHIDEYLTQSVRNRIDQLVDLNLDEHTVMTLLSNDLFMFEDYQKDETIRYIQYIIWLNDKGKSREGAFEKYKHQTKQDTPIASVEAIFETPASETKYSALSDLEESEYEIEQRKRERERIQQIMNGSRAQALEESAYASSVEELVEEFSDAELEATLSEIQEISDEVLENTIADLMDEINTPVYETIEDAYGSDYTLEYEEKANIFNNQVELPETQLEFSETISNANLGDFTVVNDAIDLDTTAFEEQTFSELLGDSKSVSATATYKIFDDEITLEDNATQTLDNSFVMDEEPSEIDLPELVATLNIPAVEEVENEEEIIVEPSIQEVIDDIRTTVEADKYDDAHTQNEDIVELAEVTYVAEDDEQEKVEAELTFEEPVTVDELNIDEITTMLGLADDSFHEPEPITIEDLETDNVEEASSMTIKEIEEPSVEEIVEDEEPTIEIAVAEEAKTIIHDEEVKDHDIADHKTTLIDVDTEGLEHIGIGEIVLYKNKEHIILGMGIEDDITEVKIEDLDSGEILHVNQLKLHPQK